MLPGSTATSRTHPGHDVDRVNDESATRIFPRKKSTGYRSARKTPTRPHPPTNRRPKRKARDPHDDSKSSRRDRPRESRRGKKSHPFLSFSPGAPSSPLLPLPSTARVIATMCRRGGEGEVRESERNAREKKGTRAPNLARTVHSPVAGYAQKAVAW